MENIEMLTIHPPVGMTDADHVNFMWGLISGVKKFMLDNSARISFTSFTNYPCPLSPKNSRYCQVLSLASLVHFLTVDLKGSLRTIFLLSALGR